MLIELNKDPLYLKNDSPIKLIKQKDIQRKKQIMRKKKMGMQSGKKQISIELVNPLIDQLRNHRPSLQIRAYQTSKASESLKKYVIEQQKNLKCLRADKISISNREVDTKRLPALSMEISRHMEEQANNCKDAYIPQIQEMFKNQNRDYLVHESATLRERLKTMISTLSDGITKFESLGYQNTEPLKKTENKMPKTCESNEESEYELDKIIEKRLIKCQQLTDKLYRQKMDMKGKFADKGEDLHKSTDISYFLRRAEQTKKLQRKKRIKLHLDMNESRQIQVTSTSSLLSEIHQLSLSKNKKQNELNRLLKNSYQNRDPILRQKKQFYEANNSYSDLSPSHQFELRKVMNKRLNHRLQIGKEQVNKFVSYLHKIKEYHIVLNNTILEILKEVRETLRKGRVMKIADLQQILRGRDIADLKGESNELIIKTLTQMMI